MYKPKLHATPIKNWMNDPNGFIYYNGEYHLFYQHFPYEPQWGTMHWGHLVSKDLVHFEDLGIALYPSKSYDRNGCFSGSAIEIDGKMHIYYTAVYYDETSNEDIHHSTNHVIQSQAMLISEDGYTFNNRLKKQIIPCIDDPGIGDAIDTRDPKVFQIEDTYYMILGTTINQKGRALIYTSKNGIDWEVASTNDSDELGTMLECPDLFNVNGKWILCGSPMNTHLDGINYPSHCQHMLVNFDPKTCKIDFLTKPQLIDYGMDYYAATSTTDKDNNRVMIGWMRMAAPSSDWNGLFTFPRIVDYQDDHVYFRVHPNILQHFTIPTDHIDDQDAYHISCNVKNGSELNVAGMLIKMGNNQIFTDRSSLMAKSNNNLGHRNHIGVKFNTPEIDDHAHLDIFIDQNIIEIYVNDGYYVLSNIIYNQTNTLETKDVTDLWIKKAK